ncbi:MAG: ACP S-malonyltransferase [Candidatus Omnitrophica bacterium]|nr:ACP S-malonyltransferase [Candidatus Omnitrophota bacterium]MDD5574400.1 ACP S-malonyltransferase [Candidatus Omnitrophota bacterium]
MKTAFLFPGQGAQMVGMGLDLYQNSNVARAVFDEADQIIGFSLSRLCFEGPFGELTRTENCQPAILTASIAALRELEVCRPDIKPSYVAGLSLGEYSALVASGVIGFADALQLVRRRGELMEAAAKKNPGIMLCVLGLEKDVVTEVGRAAGGEIANLNCPGQIIVSVKKQYAQMLADAAMARGAKRVIPLDVGGAFHCSLMDEARDGLMPEIGKISFQAPRIPLVSNVDAKEQIDPFIIKVNLVNQVNSVTYWEASMRYLLENGVSDFYEVGPGNVLKGLMRKIEPGASVISAGSWEDMKALAGETNK